jgi:Flp pilus assembly protein TadD
MRKRLRLWHVMTAGLVAVAPLGLAACGDGAPQGAVDRESGRSKLPPSPASRGGELASVVPSGKAAPAVEAPPVDQAPVPPSARERRPAEEETLDSLALAAERRPEDVAARVKFARALLEAGRRGEARRNAELAVDQDDGSSAAWNLLGRIELADRDYEAAVTAFEQAGEASPDNSFAWNNLGYALIELGRFDEAVGALEKATGGTRPTGYMWNNLGMAYEQLDRIREARAAYRLAAEAGSDKGQVNLDRLEGVVSLKRSIDSGDEE